MGTVDGTTPTRAPTMENRLGMLGGNLVMSGACLLYGVLRVILLGNAKDWITRLLSQ
jgi:hypothetical protein